MKTLGSVLLVIVLTPILLVLVILWLVKDLYETVLDEIVKE